MTSFHRSVQTLFDERKRLRVMIIAFEGDDSQEANAAVNHLWARIDELDRQIGVAYYWHAISAPEVTEPTA